jgi:hypothetical protein
LSGPTTVTLESEQPKLLWIVAANLPDDDRDFNRNRAKGLIFLSFLRFAAPPLRRRALSQQRRVMK